MTSFVWTKGLLLLSVLFFANAAFSEPPPHFDPSSGHIRFSDGEHHYTVQGGHVYCEVGNEWYHVLDNVYAVAGPLVLRAGGNAFRLNDIETPVHVAPNITAIASSGLMVQDHEGGNRLLLSTGNQRFNTFNDINNVTRLTGAYFIAGGKWGRLVTATPKVLDFGFQSVSETGLILTSKGDLLMDNVLNSNFVDTKTLGIVAVSGPFALHRDGELLHFYPVAAQRLGEARFGFRHVSPSVAAIYRNYYLTKDGDLFELESATDPSARPKHIKSGVSSLSDWIGGAFTCAGQAAVQSEIVTLKK